MNIFLIYARNDLRLVKSLLNQLSSLENCNLVDHVYSRDVVPGHDRKKALLDNLASSEIILLLISANFLSSNECKDELRISLERSDQGKAHVIPVILKPCNWQEQLFAKLQVLPKDGKPVTSWRNQDEAFLNIVQGVREAIEKFKQLKTPLSSPSSANSQATSVTMHFHGDVYGAAGNVEGDQIQHS